MPQIVRAISIRQPWVELILRGLKKKEYRVGPTRIRERVWIYVSLREDDDARAWRQTGKQKGKLPTGLIIGSVEITGCSFNSRLDCYQYTLARPKRLRRPLVASNQPSPRFWKPVFGRKSPA